MEEKRKLTWDMLLQGTARSCSDDEARSAVVDGLLLPSLSASSRRSLHLTTSLMQPSFLLIVKSWATSIIHSIKTHNAISLFVTMGHTASILTALQACPPICAAGSGVFWQTVMNWSVLCLNSLSLSSSLYLVLSRSHPPSPSPSPSPSLFLSCLSCLSVCLSISVHNFFGVGFSAACRLILRLGWTVATTLTCCLIPASIAMPSRSTLVGFVTLTTYARPFHFHFASIVFIFKL